MNEFVTKSTQRGYELDTVAKNKIDIDLEHLNSSREFMNTNERKKDAHYRTDRFGNKIILRHQRDKDHSTYAIEEDISQLMKHRNNID